MNLAELQREVHAIATDHGWWPSVPRCRECDLSAVWDDGKADTGLGPGEPDGWYCLRCGDEVGGSPGPIEERTFGDCIAVLHLGLSNVLEAYRELGFKWWMRPYSMPSRPSKPEGVPYELADVVIRVADMAEHYHWDLDAVSIPEPEEWMEFSPPKSFGDWIGLCHIHASDALVKAWIPPERFQTPSVSLNLVIRTVQRMAAHYGIDLDAAIEAKLEYNRSRSYRHGGKAL